MKTPSNAPKATPRTKRPVTVAPAMLVALAALAALAAPKHPLHTKIMRMTDGSCIHLTSVCTITLTSSGKLEHTVIQNVQDRVNHPRWSGISMETDTNESTAANAATVVTVPAA